ncbi:MAG: helix-turn-helix domain-containing protein [Archangium sp.]|nr:helix-turn-helix domain-containing protein [Archangium sp.]
MTLPRLLERLARRADSIGARRSGGFSLVEHAWHLAELEREGFQVRVHRLLHERAPRLLDFDGSSLARERQYARRELADGVRAFREARRETEVMLRSIEGADWLRAGWQDGVGRVVLRELPGRIAAHDRAHALELAELLPRGDALRLDFESFAAAIPERIASPCRNARAPGPFVALAVLSALPAPRLASIAATLRLSPRTLQRRLRASGLTLRCLVGEVRLSQAFDALCSGRSSVRSAMDAGFSDRTALSRALKRWTGTSTQTLRKRC